MQEHARALWFGHLGVIQDRDRSTRLLGAGTGHPIAYASSVHQSIRSPMMCRATEHKTARLCLRVHIATTTWRMSRCASSKYTGPRGLRLGSAFATNATSAASCSCLLRAFGSVAYSPSPSSCVGLGPAAGSQLAVTCRTSSPSGSTSNRSTTSRSVWITSKFGRKSFPGLVQSMFLDAERPVNTSRWNR